MSPQTTSTPLAIIGIGFRGPGDGSTPEKFWQMLLDARSARCEIPKERYDIDGFYHPDPERLGSIQPRHAHFLKQDFKAFDAPFFSVTPKEAKAMDPTHRMLLEATYEGFENAGLSLEGVAGTLTSCYIGTFTGDFPNLQARDNEGPSIYHATGLSSSLASNRLSWFYDLKGPSMTIDTACSSSLTAFHLGCQSIRTGEAEMSVVAGANLMFGPDMSILLGAAKILSPDGKSKMWDSKANGFSRGEGFGITILKSLDAALRDGDTIRAVVLASAANEDGRTPGISLPNSEAQQALIRTAYRQAGVDPSETGYVEAHGTGTQAGDPLEAKAILGTIGQNRTESLYVGSVKTNIGHLEGAAGVAGVIKAALIVERGIVPQNLWFETLNPAISLPENVQIPLQSTRWPTSGPRRASVNSFGFGGANAHVILEDAASYLKRKGLTGCHATVLHPTLPAPTNGHGGHSGSNGVLSPKPKIFLFSSNDKDGVKRNVERMEEYLKNKDGVSSTFLTDLAHTISAKRSTLPWKSFVVASDISQLQQSLSCIPAPVRSSSTSETKIAFVFTGQGAQWFAMGKELSIFQSFKNSMLKSEAILKSLGCPWSLEEELSRPEKESNIRATNYSQPACTALQVALVDLLKEWGVRPVAVVGHSSGEIAAAYCAGMIGHEAAVEIAWKRGQVSTTIAQSGLKGGMLAVNASVEVVQPKLDALTRGKAVVSCFNCWSSCTVSGDQDAIDELQEMLKENQIACTRLPMDVAYHSFHMETVRALYEAALAGIPHVATGQIPMFSSVTGALVTPKEMNPSYWVQNLVKPVNFTVAMVSLLNHNNGQKRTNDRQAFANIFLEVGPHSALRSYVLDIFKGADKFVDLSYESMLRKNFDGVETALQAMGNVWTKAYPIDMDLVNESSTNVKMLVDLPPYAWNHSHTFWDESHLSRAYRLREKPRMDLLGYRVIGTPEPTWRNFLRCNENPWIREHKVQGAILYPGAGMLVMAIEAAKQLADPNEVVHGYELRDVNIVTALRVPDTEKGIEVILQFHPRRTGTKAAPSTSLNEFSVSSWSEEAQEWTVHARGLISTTYKSTLSTNMQHELQLQQEKQKQDFLHAMKVCERPARSFLYDTVETIGMEYGPTFRNMTELFAGPGSSYGVVSVPDTKAVMPQNFEYPAVIHPATLDSILHLLFPCISGDEQALTEAVVPFSFDRVFVSASTPTDPASKLHGFCTAKKTSYTTWMSSITVSDGNHYEPLIIMEGLGLASVGGSDASNAVETKALCFGQVWHETIDLLEPSHVKELVYRRTIPNKDDESVLGLLEYICLVYIYRTLEWFQGAGTDFVPVDGFWQKYVEWMKDVVQDFPPLSTSSEEVESKMVAARKRIAHSESGDITVQMVDRIGQNLANIFTRKVEPLQVMTEGDLLYTFYRGAFGTSFNSNVAEYVGLIADKNPGLSILEIGAGTGGTTFHVLERLRNEDGTSKASRYFFTDISPGFLAKAQDRFLKDGSTMEFGTLNIENNPIDQGFEPESFDLIVCANVLHATKSIQETLTHCRAVLKPGGKLILSEVTIKRIFSGFIMGPLPGWWLGEDDGRKGGPLLDAEEWNTALLQADFSGVDLDVRGDREESKEPVSLIVSTKPDTSRVKPATKYAILSSGTKISEKLAAALQSLLCSAGQKASISDWSSLTGSDVRDKYCISLIEWEAPLLANLTSEGWSTLRQVISAASGTLWITGGAAMDCSHPMQSLMVGLARAIRNEDAGVVLATLDIETPDLINVKESSASILKLALDHSRGDSLDGEYALRGKTIFVPRVERTTSVDAALRRYESKGEPELVSFTGCGRPLKLTIKTPGLLDTFRWQEDEKYFEPMPEDWIEIEVKAVGLNFKDVLVALGNLNEKKLGVDASGVITRVGSAVTQFAVGDRVMTASCDTFATFVRFPMQGAIPMPAEMSFEKAASMPLIFLTAYYALVTAGGLVKGETVLIHAAAGGVGQAAIILAKQIGAEIFATVGPNEKKELIMETYSIPEDHIFSSRDTSFAKGVMRATNGCGVDVVLNSLSGEALRVSWHCLNKFGRFLEIGKADLFANTGLDMKPFLDNKSYIGVNLLDFENNPTPRAIALWGDVAKLIETGSLRPVFPLQIFTLSEVEKAFRYMQTGKHMGKVIVKVDDSDMVPAIPRTPQVGVRSGATYIIAGIGGICREIARWLAEKGAESLVFLSRSAATGAENAKFAADLRKTYGVKILAFDCDVGHRAALETALEQCKSLPPIKGCVTGAMVLDDTLFDKMTAEQVQKTVGPKVHGTWNLHELLPKDMDFFVMLSSLAGVMGHRGQGNYGCGNIFQDYFASFRRSQGLPAMTIDIGYLLSVGFVAEHDEYVDHVKAMGLKVMHNSDLHGLLSIAMDGNDAHPAQVMCGLPYNEYSEAWYWIQDGRFAALRNRAGGAAVGSASSISLRDELTRCADASDAIDLVTAALVQRLAKLMMMPESDVDAGKPLSAYGVDSLVAVEVRNWIAKEMAVEVSVFDLMANVPMRQLASDLVGKSKLLQDIK
ncbi:fatty acid synthase S-acetyltransferase [Leptodontidium sp. 2 PMI_412]|nr:fatty acid synthase S-acetyltransferase [Leptodontidium sp. 2 PMI_412]